MQGLITYADVFLRRHDLGSSDPTVTRLRTARMQELFCDSAISRTAHYHWNMWLVAPSE